MAQIQIKPEAKTRKVLKVLDNRYHIINKLLRNNQQKSFYFGWDNQSKEVLTVLAISKTEVMKKIKNQDHRVFSKDLFEYQLKNQMNILEKIKHQNIVRLKKFSDQPEAIYMFYDYCPQGSLEQILARNNGINFHKALSYWRQMIKACYYLQSQWVIHQFIEPKNILVNENDQVKLINFKSAFFYEDHNEYFNQFIEKTEFTAPEIYSGAATSSKTDVWGLGITLYFMLYKQHPWQGIAACDWHKRLPSTLQFPKEPCIPRSLQNTLRRMLNFDKGLRPTLDQLVVEFL